MPRTLSKTKKKLSSRKKTTVRGSAVKKRPAKRAPTKKSLLRAVRARSKKLGQKKPHQLERHEYNPIIEPRDGRYWETKATFNPGAVYADKRVHLLYRAIGGDDMSVLGYASSADGVTVIERLDEPAFVPDVDKKTAAERERAQQEQKISPAYFSGGGWNGGCEDPRITLLDGRVYLTYTAFDGWGSIRIALTSISLEDFLNKHWRWKKSALISPPGEIHKNWMLFPEKINGKYAILHSISPEILVDYFDTLDELEGGERVIQSGRTIILRKGSWDSWIRGAGPPPIKTDLGWLLFYHAMDMKDPNRYKLGAMILDANDPTKILYRSQSPILEPDFSYENSGFKSGVVYSCGAVVKDGELYVYYGGGDSVTCVAMARLDRFLDDLKKYGTPKLTPEKKESSSHGRR
jgi:beta-1,2-mannobiose phosphorylase / 1,2-beta-oligomannan phosphorylase